MTRKKQRMTFVVAGVGALAAATLLVLFALQDSIVFFHSPTEVMAVGFATDRAIRIGGLVEEGSVERAAGDATVRFHLTDLQTTVPVVFAGILPALFREGQGIVAEGRMEGGIFVASDVLAKHDENYMPAEVVDALKAAGQWREE